MVERVAGGHCESFSVNTGKMKKRRGIRKKTDMVDGWRNGVEEGKKAIKKLGELARERGPVRGGAALGLV
jgi:hypothetical protein